LNLSSTPIAKSDGDPILKRELGSNSVLGKKKRRNIRKFVSRNAEIAVQIRRRRVFSASSSWGADPPRLSAGTPGG
jgi:hypothetical protein